MVHASEQNNLTKTVTCVCGATQREKESIPQRIVYDKAVELNNSAWIHPSVLWAIATEFGIAFLAPQLFAVRFWTINVLEQSDRQQSTGNWLFHYNLTKDRDLPIKSIHPKISIPSGCGFKSWFLFNPNKQNKLTK